MTLAENRRKAREWYYANCEKAKRRIHRWQKDNPDKVKRYRKKNRAVILQGQRKCYRLRRKYYIDCSKRWARANPEERRRIGREWARKATLQKHGLTEEKCASMRKNQKGRCLICNLKKKLVIDHCHCTGIVRGLLCVFCNIGLGSFRDSPTALRNAAAYLEKSL